MRFIFLGFIALLLGSCTKFNNGSLYNYIPPPVIPQLAFNLGDYRYTFNTVQTYLEDTTGQPPRKYIYHIKGNSGPALVDITLRTKQALSEGNYSTGYGATDSTILEASFTLNDGSTDIASLQYGALFIQISVDNYGALSGSISGTLQQVAEVGNANLSSGSFNQWRFYLSPK